MLYNNVLEELLYSRCGSLYLNENAITGIPYVAMQMKPSRGAIHKWPETDTLYDPMDLHLFADEVHISANSWQLLGKRHVKNSRSAHLSLDQNHAWMFRDHAPDPAGIPSLGNIVHRAKHGIRA